MNRLQRQVENNRLELVHGVLHSGYYNKCNNRQANCQSSAAQETTVEMYSCERLIENGRGRVLAFFRPLDRQAHREGTALADLGGDRDAAAMSLGDPFDDRQAEACAAVHAVARLVDPVEPVEDVCQVLGIDADPRVGEGELQGSDG